MTRKMLAAGAAALAFAASPAAAQEFRIGFINTLTGGGALPGMEQVNGWRLGLEHEGWTKDGDKLGGVATRIFMGDDQQKTDVGLQAVSKVIDQDKVHLVAGIIWSNVLMASIKKIADSKVPLVITNAGAAPVAGKDCNPLFMSTSWNNDQVPEALGTVMTEDKLASIYLLAPNYQAGKDMVAGLKRTLKGPKIVDETYFKLGEADFQANISQVRAAKPAALFVFAPGSMGVAFMKQWAASGLGKDVKLYTVFTVDQLTMPAIGDSGVGSFIAMYWNEDLKNPANEKFVKAFAAKHGRSPSHYAAQAYDAPRLIAAALKATGGKYDDPMALARALRKTKYDSVRGPYEYNVNGMPIQNFYKKEIIKGADGKPTIVTRGTVFTAHKDAYWQECPADKRL
jgi:branched-chain amino acid transport system substrate-binding protein